MSSNQSHPDRTDRILGCIVGGAIGDALGGPYEGRPGPVEVDPNTIGRISDDTQLTLAACEAIAAAGRVDPERIAGRMAEWFREGRLRGLGASTLKSLSELVQGGHWALVGRKGEHAAGNGAAMRAAPLAFLLDPADPVARRTIRDVSRITHHHEEAYAGALAVIVAVRAAWDGTWRGELGLLGHVRAALPDCRVKGRLTELIGVEGSLSLGEIAARWGCSGYVVESVPLALCGAARVRSLAFRGMLDELISAGGDTDTIAAIAGQVAGTLIGRRELPDELLARLPEAETIADTAVDFAQRACQP